MGCSASKARDSGRGQRDGEPQRELDLGAVLVDTAKDTTEERQAFHPAAAVFLSEALAGVGDENKMLEIEISRYKHLHDFIQKLVISFSTPSRTIHERHTSIVFENSMSVETLLSNGSVVIVDDKERLVIPITDAAAHPVDDSGVIGNISVALAGMPFDNITFYQAVNVRTDDGVVHLTIYLSPLIWIEGRLDAQTMSNEDLIAFVERDDVRFNLKMPIPLHHMHFSQSNEIGITFTPTFISMTFTSRLRKTLSLVAGAPVSAPHDCTGDDLRRLVVEAIGESEHKELWDKNNELKAESTALSEIIDFISRIEVSHSTGILSVSLDEGQIAADWWKITVDERENTSLSIEDIGHIGLSFMGVQCAMNVYESDTTPDIMLLFFRIHRSLNIRFILMGTFNWDDFAEDEILEIAEDFRMKLHRVLEGNGKGVFPATMKFKIHAILCDAWLAQFYLGSAGLWEEPATDN